MPHAMETNPRPRPRLILVTTVPETMATILVGQPGHLAKYFDVSLIASPGALVARVEQQEGLAVKAVSMERGIHPVKDLVSVWRMWRTLRRQRPDVVHSYTPKAGLVVMLSAWLCRVPIRVHTFTGLIFPTATGLKQRILIWVDRLICACATHVVPEGVGVQKDLERYRITDKPLRVIGHGNIAGVNTKYFDPEAAGVSEEAVALKQRLGIASDAVVFCFVGRLNRDKGVAELYAAFSTLPEQVHLLLVGGVDASAPISKELQAAIENHSRVHAVGFMDDIRPALSLANVLVLPSYREGFPNVVLQAGAMALPVIATDISGCNEVVEPGLNGWLVPPRDAPALTDAMQDALRAPGKVRKEMGLRARERVQLWFEQQQHWQRMVLFYQGLLGAQHRD